MDYKDKIDVLFMFWDRKGNPRPKDTLYFGWKFKDCNQYLDALAKYYHVDDMKQHMLSEIENILTNSEYDKCDISMKLVSWNVENTPMSIFYDGYGMKPIMKFRHIFNPKWSIPKDFMKHVIDNVRKDIKYFSNPKFAREFADDAIALYINEMYNNTCVNSIISKVTDYIYEKYGFLSNINSKLIDDTQLEGLIDYYTNIVLSKT